MATATSNPRVRVRDATRADLPRILDIFFDAFDTHTVNRFMYSGPPTASARAVLGAGFFPAEKADGTETAPGPGPGGRVPRMGEELIKVAELLPLDGTGEEAGEVVAFAKFTWNKEPREEWEWNAGKDFTVEDFGEGVNVEFANVFIGGLKRKERVFTRGDPNLSQFPSGGSAKRTLY